MKNILIILLLMSNILYSQNARLPFKNGEKCTYLIHYGIINAGYGEISVTNKKGSFQFIGQGRSNIVFDWFFRIRDRYESHVDKNTLLPEYFNRKIYEGGDIINQEYFFNHATNKVKTNKGDFTMMKNSQDMLSSIFYGRSLNANFIKNNKYFHIDMFLDEEYYKMKVNYLGTEIVNTVLGNIRCIKLSPTVKVGRVFRNEDDLTLWISDDQNHLLIKVEMGVLVGSIKAEIQTVKNIKFPLSIND